MAISRALLFYMNDMTYSYVYAIMFIVWFCMLYGHIYTHTHAHARTHARTHTQTHTHTHTHTHTNISIYHIYVKVGIQSCSSTTVRRRTRPRERARGIIHEVHVCVAINYFSLNTYKSRFYCDFIGFHVVSICCNVYVIMAYNT